MVAWGGDKKWSSEDFDDIEFEDCNAATTYLCKHKPTDRMCVLIRFCDKKYMADYSIVAHEALHATLFILGYIGSEITVDNSEPACYLLQWVVSCCEKVRLGKTEKE